MEEDVAQMVPFDIIPPKGVVESKGGLRERTIHRHRRLVREGAGIEIK